MTTIGPGMRVRCINDAWKDINGPVVVCPTLGSIWTVQRVWRSGETNGDWLLGRDYLALEETGSDLYRMDYFSPIKDLGDLRELAREPKNQDAPVRHRELV